MTGYREPIFGVDYKACKGCGDDCDMDQFMYFMALLKEDVESDYCAECRKTCPTCGDWVGECGGVHEEPEFTFNPYTGRNEAA
jgi:hypothetical protein